MYILMTFKKESLLTSGPGSVMFNDSSLDEVIKALLNQKYPGSVSWDREKWDTKHRIIVEISESEFGPHTAEVFGSTDEISELATALNKALGV